MFANPQLEQMTHDELRALQLQRLKKTIAWAYEKSGIYKRKFDAAGVTPDDLRTLDDISKFPFTTERELQEHSPHEFLTLPFSAISRISLWEHPTPIIRMYTARDIACNVEMMTRSLVAADITRASVVGVLGDLADSSLMDTQYALEVLGTTVVPLGTEYERAIKLLDATYLSIIIGSARRVLRLVIQAQAMGRDIKDFNLTTILCFNENLQNPLKIHMRNRMGTQVYNFFASSSFGTGGMFYQCKEHVGHHLQEDYFYPEVAAFGEDNTINDPSCMGELILTSLTAEALPLIRYRTGQTVMRLNELCSCGRSFVRFTTPFGSFN